MRNESPDIDRWKTFRTDRMPEAMYWHVPFCRRRCGYCNFTLVAGRDQLIEPFLQALETEIGWLQGRPRLTSVYWGGGTPSHLGLRQLERLGHLLTRQFELDENAEFTVEANPEDITREKLRLLASFGVNRISLGVQSFHPRKIRILERNHTPEQARAAIASIRDVIGNVAVDLIFAAPDETAEEWRQDLESVIAAEPDHVSTYDLTFEKGTSFWGRMVRGELAPQADDPRVDMYRQAIDRLTSAGFTHYEVSNFSRPNRRARHNMVYWNGQEYLAFGPGASRFVSGVRETNHRSVTTWLKRVREGLDPVVEREALSDVAMTADRIAFGLRQLDGIDLGDVMAGIDDASRVVFEELIAQFSDNGWLVRESDVVRLTASGLLVYDTIAASFIQAAGSN